MIDGKRICPVMSRPTVVELCPEPDDKKFAKGEGFVIIDDTAYDGIIFCPHSDDCEFWKELRLVSGATKWQCAYTHTSVNAGRKRGGELMANINKSEKNKGLHNAKKGKQDEFYTQLTDIEKELKHYKDHFKGKVIFCNCDDPEESNFWKYFSLNFEKLKLKKLISTHYVTSGQSYKLEMKKNGEQSLPLPLDENGDFRSQECIDLLKEADIVVTNPPFSLFREYVNQLIEYNKKFIIIGNQNAITYKEIFSFLQKDKMWLGCSIHSGDREFRVPDHYPLDAAGYRIDQEGKKYIRIKGVRWFTNLDYKERHEDLILYKKYNEKDYLKYDNYDAINVDKTKDIPVDYDGKIGVPITFMDKYNPDQFEIVGRMTTTKVDEFNQGYPYINGEKIYARIVIKKKVN